MTGQELKEYLESNEITPELWWRKYRSFSASWDDDVNISADVLTTIGEAEVVEEEGGEGEGDSACFTVYFKDHDVYLKAYGAYYSYEGYDYTEVQWRIVAPQQKTITVYEPIKN